MFKTKEINDVSIKPVIHKTIENKNNVRAFKYYENPYSNICLIARKNSGKSTVIYRALEQCVKKGTNVFLFSPTVNIDPTYAKMIAMLKRKKCNVVSKDHFIDENGIDLIGQLLNIFSKKDDINEKKEQEPFAPPLLYFGNDKNYKHCNVQVGGDCLLVERPPTKKTEQKKEKKEKDKLITPEHIFVFDDLSTSLRHNSIGRLLVKNRHYKLKCFFSCHSVNNLDKMALASVDVFHVFPNISNEKIAELGEKVNITFKNDNKKDTKLQRLYDDATAKPFNFLYIDRNNGTFRKNFNHIYNIGGEE